MSIGLSSNNKIPANYISNGNNRINTPIIKSEQYFATGNNVEKKNIVKISSIIASSVAAIGLISIGFKTKKQLPKEAKIFGKEFNNAFLNNLKPKNWFKKIKKPEINATETNNAKQKINTATIDKTSKEYIEKHFVNEEVYNSLTEEDKTFIKKYNDILGFRSSFKMYRDDKDMTKKIIDFCKKYEEEIQKKWQGSTVEDCKYHMHNMLYDLENYINNYKFST